MARCTLLIQEDPISEKIFQYELGAIAKDKVSGYKGVIIARTQWQYGCVRYIVQSQSLHDGKPVEAQSFDEGQLDVEDQKAPKEDKQEKRAERSPGGPKPTPTRAADPKRR